jgi:hypothetical protein
VQALTAKLLASEQHVFSPIVYSAPLAERFALPGDWDFWRGLDLDFIDRCDQLWVYQLPGWDLSVGVGAEIDHARATGKPVVFVQFEQEKAA